jgi:hypothetical protein
MSLPFQEDAFCLVFFDFFDLKKRTIGRMMMAKTMIKKIKILIAEIILAHFASFSQKGI